MDQFSSGGRGGNGTGVTFSADFPIVASGGQIFANGVVFARQGS
jgi:hypothetical protein